MHNILEGCWEGFGSLYQVGFFLIVAKGQTTEDARSNAGSPQHEATGAGEIYKHR